MFTRITVRDGRIHGWEHHQPFDALFGTPQFKHGS
jgi:hypothetical protein